MTSGTSNNVMWFKEIPGNTDVPVKLKQVFPCHCGIEHTLDTAGDCEAYLLHNCYHDKGFIWLHAPDSAICRKCGVEFHIGDLPTICWPCPVCAYLLTEEPINYGTKVIGSPIPEDVR